MFPFEFSDDRIIFFLELSTIWFVLFYFFLSLDKMIALIVTFGKNDIFKAN